MCCYFARYAKRKGILSCIYIQYMQLLIIITVIVSRGEANMPA